MNIDFKIPDRLMNAAIRNIDSYESVAGRELDKFESGAVNFRTGAVQGVVGTVVVTVGMYAVGKLVRMFVNRGEQGPEWT